MKSRKIKLFKSSMLVLELLGETKLSIQGIDPYGG